MFSPGEIALIDLRPPASLLCAVTSFLRLNRSEVQNAAQRDSFSLGASTPLRISRACGAG